MASRWDGRILARDNVSEGSTFAFSPNGRYAAAMEDNPPYGHPSLWILDVERARVVKRKPLPKQAGEALGWVDSKTVGLALLMGDKLTPVLRLGSAQPKEDVPVYGRPKLHDLDLKGKKGERKAS